MLWLQVAPLLLAGALNILVGLLVLLRDPKQLGNICFFVLAAAVAGWVGGIAFFILAPTRNDAFIWAKIYYLFPLIIAVSSVAFVQVWPGENKLKLRWFIPALFGFLVLSIPLMVVPSFLTERLVTHSWGKEIILNHAEYFVYSAYILLCYPFSILHIYIKSRHLQRLYAAQARLFYVGFIVSLTFGLIFNLFLPWLGNYRLIWIGPSFTTVFIVTVAYSIIRRRMFDVRLVVARSLAYVVVIALLLGSYALISYAAINVLADALGSSYRTIANLVLIAIAAASYAPLMRYFNRVSNKIFYHDAYDPQSLIDEVNRSLVTNFELEPLLRDVSRILATNFKAEYCLFGLKETQVHDQRIFGTLVKTFPPQDIAYVRSITPNMKTPVILTDLLTSQHRMLKKVLNRNDIAALVRIAPSSDLVQEGIGYMVLGRKKSGAMYSTQDARMLAIIANELLIAIQNALHFDEIQQFNVTLQDEVDMATRKLRRQNKKLEELDNIKDDFISMASHQLRTPLTSVKGYLSMVLEGDAGKLTHDQNMMLKQAFASSQRMVFLITDLLNVSRLKTGKFVIDAAPTNLKHVVEQELAQLRETAAAKSLELTYNPPKTFPELMLDEVKIRQVIMNYVDNAIYYTPSGGRIKVELAETPTTVELRVIDNGIGVPRDEQHHLFTKFYRATNARTARPDGTGLGLFMAQKVIAAQGGSIIFESKEGKGSTFGFSFSKSRLAKPTLPSGSGDESKALASTLAKAR